MWIDTHAHLDDPRFTRDLPDVLRRAWAIGVGVIVNIGYDLPSSQRVTHMASAWAGQEDITKLYAAVGVHPHDARTLNQQGIAELTTLASHPSVLAIGEIGLDYHYDLSPRAIQQNAFREQLRLAKRLALPVVIHTREAHADTLQILQEEQPQCGIMHCFPGSLEMARECIKLGLYIAIGGSVTFKNAKQPLEVAAAIPEDSLLLETDCPYLSPVPHRGQRNEPIHLLRVAERVADLRGISLEALAELTTRNAHAVFGGMRSADSI